MVMVRACVQCECTGEALIVLPAGFGQSPVSAELLAQYVAAGEVAMRKLLEMSKLDAGGFEHVRFLDVQHSMRCVVVRAVVHC
jgi:hypothetical protein